MADAILSLSDEMGPMGRITETGQASECNKYIAFTSLPSLVKLILSWPKTQIFLWLRGARQRVPRLGNEYVKLSL